jgi:ribosomal protein L17
MPAQLKLKNTNIEETRTIAKEMRRVARNLGCTLAFRGRCSDRKAAFAKTGRQYVSGIANRNDISLRNPEAQYCDSFSVYRSASTTTLTEARANLTIYNALTDVLGQRYWEKLK